MAFDGKSAQSPATFGRSDSHFAKTPPSPPAYSTLFPDEDENEEEMREVVSLFLNLVVASDAD